MYDHGQKSHPGHKSTGTGEADRRNADRHSITASAEVVELGSGARFSTRTTDLGPGGCFVDTMVPFPVGASVRVSVRKGKTQFESSGIVVYSQAGLGMGIAFDTMEPQQRQELDEWLTELTGEKQTLAPYSAGSAPIRTGNAQARERAALVRLVKLMITKGILTEAEGSSVLVDPLL
jgi:PilZ domain-containing protein